MIVNNFVYFGKTVQFQWFSDDWWGHTAAQCQDCREHSLQCQTFKGGSLSVGGNVQVWKCSVAKGFSLVQADARLVDSSGEQFPVHGYLLKLLFPVFRGIKLRKDQVREDISRKKTFSFGHCPNPLNPPPLTPIRATWSSFLDVKNDVLRVWPKFFLMMIMMVSMIIMMIILVILMIIMTKMTKKHTITVKFE